MMKKGLVLLFVISGIFGLSSCSTSHNNGHSHYAGQEKREIKALSDEDIKNYLEGNGAGFAKSAELNGFPGPKHILENDAKLDLTAEQKQKVTESYNSMKARAMKLGKEIVNREKEFDKLFLRNDIESGVLTKKAREIGSLQGTLRSVHLKAHLEMKKLLSDGQLKKYQELRGYSN